jgi:dihydrofolate synthase/folylpolyglutamate synthase
VLITGSITLVAEARELLGAPSAGAPGPGTPEAVAVPTAVDVFNDFGLELGDGLDEDEEDFDDIFDETGHDDDGGPQRPQGSQDIRGSRADGGKSV